MRKVYYEDYEDLAETISNDYYDLDENILADDYCSIGIVAKYEDTSAVVEELIRDGFNILQISDLSEPIFSGYVDEFYITLTSEGEILCERAKVGNNYKLMTQTICYVFEYCNSKILDKIYAKRTYEVHVENEDDYDCCDLCDDECSKCELLNDSDECDNESEEESDDESTIYFHDDTLAIEGVANLLKLFGIKIVVD